MAQIEMTPRQAAQRLGVRLGCVYSLIWDGVLRAEKRDGRWFILLSSIESRLHDKPRRPVAELSTKGYWS